MDEKERETLWALIAGDMEEAEFQTAPLLAHYTSIYVLEQILKTDEVWLSHPLLMNDHEEIIWGIVNGANELEISPALRNTLGPQRHDIFIDAIRQHVKFYGDIILFDTYVFCFSELDEHDDDGRLSMWRSYGGNGTGAALVIDPRRLSKTATSPLLLEPVRYKSPADRLQMLRDFVAEMEAILRAHWVADQDLGVFAGFVFERLKLTAIFHKHIGFAEEREWRLVYMPERDRNEAFTPGLDYFNGSRGLEPILRFKVMHIPGATSPDLSLAKVTAKIILGPSPASTLTYKTTVRMLERTQKQALIPTLRVSRIPFRASAPRTGS